MSKKRKISYTGDIPWLDVDDVDSELRLFDPDSPDIGLLNLIDDEVIELGGSDFQYYKFLTTNKDYDADYMEIRNKTVSRSPVLVHGHYDPIIIEESLENFGVVPENDQIFTFNRDYLNRRLGRDPIEGDIIKPKFQNIKFRIIEVQEDGFEAYGIYHWILTGKILRDSQDVHNQDVTDVTENKGTSEPDGSA